MLVYIVFISFFGLVTLIQLYYILKYYWILAFKALPIASQAGLLPVSIIIAARNESENLQKYLDSILLQDYPNFEVIVVNDCSYDLSTDLLKGYKERYAHLKVLELAEDERFKHGKKFALTLGIKSAQHEHLLFTDADCMPVSNQWLRNMQSFLLLHRCLLTKRAILQKVQLLSKEPDLVSVYRASLEFQCWLQGVTDRDSPMESR